MIYADHSGIARGQFTLPENIPAGVKSVEFIGDRGSRGVGQFTGRGIVTIEERRRVKVVQRYDPLAQTFTLLVEGRHIASIGVWFEDVGTQPVTIQIRETSTGLPTGTVLAESRITVDKISPPGEETIVDFPVPVYLEALQEYAIVILTDDNVHSLAIAEVGQYDRRAERHVTEQGYAVGVLLSSSNASTWTPHNSADLTFRIYAAEFTASRHTVDLNPVIAHDASDAYVMADVERTGSETDVTFTFMDQANNPHETQDNQAFRFDVRMNEKMTVSATLIGGPKRSPLLYPGVLAAMGNVQEKATYISRAIPAGSGDAIVTLEYNTPGNSSVTVEIEIDGEYKICPPLNGKPIGDGWIMNEYKRPITGGDYVRCRITLAGTVTSRPRARQLRMITT